VGGKGHGGQLTREGVANCLGTAARDRFVLADRRTQSRPAKLVTTAVETKSGGGA
jgi:hypothetical protein